MAHMMDTERPATPAAWRGLHAKALRQAAQNYKAGDMTAFHETLTVATVRERHLSVTLARPQDPDCPLIGCSDAFLDLTGYSRAESVGRNLRFLNKGCTMSAEDRHRMRIAVRTGKSFRGVVQNRRKSGEVFHSNVHMHALRIGDALYIVGIQADVTNSSVADSDRAAEKELKALVEDIFAANVDAWAMLQVMHHNGAKLGRVPYVESVLQPRSDPAAYIKARDAFVSIELDLLQNQFLYKNTFLEVYDCNEDTFFLGLRHVSSEPALGLRHLEGQRLQEVNNALLPSRVGGGGMSRQTEVRVATFDTLAPLETDWKRATTLDSCSKVRAQEILKDNADSRMRSTEVPPLKTGQPPWRAAHEHDNEQDFKGAHCAKDKDFDTETQAAPEQISMGSAGHPDSCRPCAFHCHSLVACNQGEACMYCHMDHPRKRRQRGRQARKARREVEGMNDDEDHKDDEGRAEAPPAVAEKVEKTSSPTPDGLVPLLTALEFLSPLPMPDIMKAATKALTALGKGRQGGQDDLASSGDQLSLEYSECSINLIVGQWKNILPFVGGDTSGAKRFRIFPALPRGLALDARTGVISGHAKATTSPGSVHTVLMDCSAGVAETVLHVQVLD
mmetsp:Transcript_48227/g.127367  ORF Transcript_48227/g.127367 Transcript_48227/m.127367 type:complete len:617 (-) Transcript_48227:49-1899(-)